MPLEPRGCALSFSVVRQAIVATSPWAELEIQWPTVLSALVVAFTPKNEGDLHKDVREALGLKARSNKTHIDVTSGSDVKPEADPVDFFRQSPGPRVSFPVQYSLQNADDLVGLAGGGARWKVDDAHIKVFKRNDDSNPSAQLLEKNDLAPLRTVVGFDQAIIFLRQQEGPIIAIGVNITSQLAAMLNGKTKRVFLNTAVTSEDPPSLTEAPGQEGPVSGQEELLEELLEELVEEPVSGQQRRANGQGRQQDPLLRQAVEERAMAVATAALEDCGFVVADVHLPSLARAADLSPSPGFDLLAGGVGVEVKGTLSAGSAVWLSYNELKSALDGRRPVLLAVVASIDVVLAIDGSRKAIGGSLRFYEWTDLARARSLLSDYEDASRTIAFGGLAPVPSSITFDVKLTSGLLKEMDTTSLRSHIKTPKASLA